MVTMPIRVQLALGIPQPSHIFQCCRAQCPKVKSWASACCQRQHTQVKFNLKCIAFPVAVNTVFLDLFGFMLTLCWLCWLCVEFDLRPNGLPQNHKVGPCWIPDAAKNMHICGWLWVIWWHFILATSLVVFLPGPQGFAGSPAWKVVRLMPNSGLWRPDSPSSAFSSCKLRWNTNPNETRHRQPLRETQ